MSSKFEVGEIISLLKDTRNPIHVGFGIVLISSNNEDYWDPILIYCFNSYETFYVSKKGIKKVSIKNGWTKGG
mgnify:FL=1